MEPNRKEAGPHILQACAHLIGICFVVLTGLHVTGFAAESIIDELAGGAAFFFLCGIIFSYLAMRRDTPFAARSHSVADYALLAGIACLSLTMFLLAFDLLA